MLKLVELSIKDLEKLENKIDLPIWASSKTTLYYEERKVLSIWSGENIKAIYLLPIMKYKNQYIVDRKFRFFPYVSPIIFEKDNVKRKEIVLILFKYIKEHFYSISIPLFPEFKDIAPIQSLGIFVFFWHTHTLKKELSMDNMTSKLKNHIRNAERKIDIIIDQDYNNYNFEKAIKGPETEIDIRRKSGINLVKNGNGFFVTGVDKETKKKFGAIMIAYDKKWAYLLHSWRDKDAPRGIIPFLIKRATEISFREKKVETFDFEGAVIQNIDNFFSGFNAEITTYPYLYWSKDKDLYVKLIEDSINIEGRLIE